MRSAKSKFPNNFRICYSNLSDYQSAFTPRNNGSKDSKIQKNLGKGLRNISSAIQRAVEGYNSINEKLSRNSPEQQKCYSSITRKTVDQVKDQVYVKQQTEKDQRINRLKEARRK
jgi:hypothetical protein